VLGEAVEVREKVGVAVGVGVLAFTPVALARMESVRRREPVCAWQGVAVTEREKLEEGEGCQEGVEAGLEERVKLLLAVACPESVAVMQAVAVAEAETVRLLRLLPEGPGTVMLVQADTVGVGEEEREGEALELAELDRLPSATQPVGLTLAVLLGVATLGLAVLLVLWQAEVDREKEVVGLRPGERDTLGLALSDTLGLGLPLAAAEAVLLTVALAEGVPPLREAVEKSIRLGVPVVVWLAVLDQDLVPVGVAVELGVEAKDRVLPEDTVAALLLLAAALRLSLGVADWLREWEELPVETAVMEAVGLGAALRVMLPEEDSETVPVTVGVMLGQALALPEAWLLTVAVAVGAGLPVASTVQVGVAVPQGVRLGEAVAEAEYVPEAVAEGQLLEEGERVS
jgi:hypothetical protein